MRIATYNVEWFNVLFDDDGELLLDGRWSRRYNVKRGEQLAALGAVFQAMDADAVMVIEAPDSSPHRSVEKALENFAKHFGLRARRVLSGFTNDTQQEIALMYDPDQMAALHDPQGPQTGKHGAGGAPRFDGVFRTTIDTDGSTETVRFSKPPLEALLTLKAGRELRLIGVHIKSKAPHGAANPTQVMQISIENRRKQLAQCQWLRNRVVDHLSAGDQVLVMGDFNDGPGLDEYERLFGRSSVEIVLGEGGGQQLFDPHAHMALSQRIGAVPTTSRFYLSDQKRYFQALLDYIMVSKLVRDSNPAWRIWHPFDDPQCFDNHDMCAALLAASDHFPVTIDFEP